MLGSKFYEIMREQPSSLNVYDEMAIMQAKSNTTNQLLRSLHRGSKEKTSKEKTK